MKLKTTVRPQLIVALALSPLLATFVLGACSEEPPPSSTRTAVPAVQPTTPPAPTAMPAATAKPAPTAAPAPRSTAIPPEPTATRPPKPTATSVPVVETIAFDASTVAITVDGNTSDWDGIRGTTIGMQQIRPFPGSDFGPVDNFNATLKVATDAENIYVLMEVPDDYDYNPDDAHLSAALGVMFRIDEAAAPHMGATEDDQDTSLGKVDIWHWELECGPGVMSGGNDAPSGNDPDCNMDDEYSTTTEEREDDGSVTAENSLAGVWEHTARSQGEGSDGTWIFEMSRPLQTGDPDDAQLTPGGSAQVALAYWDADESAEGWSDAGHVQSATGGWIEVTLP